MENTIEKKRGGGPRGGKHSEEAKQKMRDRWEERKALMEIGRRVKEVVDAAA